MTDTELNQPLRPDRTKDFLVRSDSVAKDGYSEAFTAPGQPRPHWRNLLQVLRDRGEASLQSAHERARRMRHEDGATINPFDDPSRRSTSWDLDVIPLPIPAAEWDAIVSGLIQRAILLEKVLADTYGPQKLLYSGRLPAELIFANPNFLHSCHDISPPGNRFLLFYGADLYRAADGRFRVLRDYGAKPEGLGYALENRIVMSRLVADLYHRSQVHRLAPFFKSFQQTLIERASSNEENPGFVLLSPGPDAPLYFEQALLSRYLGYPLVESEDLTVRNGKVFLKKLNGLEPVEGIFRYLADQDSDPFALRKETADGVAGLLQVCRENNIELINPIGSGFVDSPALSRFLPALSEELLGEELLLPNHPAWWCGNHEDLQYVLANIEQLSVGPAFDRRLAIDPSADPASRINSSPASYMASAPVHPSVVPTWNSDGAGSGYCMLRVFVAATAHGFAVMPGGLAITATDRITLLGNCPERQRSKDIWVLSDTPVESFSLLKTIHGVGEFNRTVDLPSRVADHLMWLGRYLERAEGFVRLLRSIFRRIAGECHARQIPELSILLNILQEKHIVATSGSNCPPVPQFFELQAQLNSALYSRDRLDSAVSVLNQVQRAALKVRDRLSIDSLRILNHLEDLVDSPSADPLEFLDETLFALSGFSGLAMESMTRSLGWRFMDMGRRVERAINQTGLIAIALPQACNDSLNPLEALLEVSDSTMTYRSRYRSFFQLAPVLDLLLADESNPKSIAFQCSRIADHVEHLPRRNERRYFYPEERTALKMLTAIRLLDLTGIRCDAETTQHENLAGFLRSMSGYLEEFSQQITAHYLTRVPATPHFSMRGGDSVT